MSFSKIPKQSEYASKEPLTNNFDQRIDAIRQMNIIDSKFGYELYTECSPKNGWLVNVQQSEVVDDKTKLIQSVVNFYFLESCGGRFKISYLFRPYLYLEAVPGNEFAVAEFLSRKYHFIQVEHVEKENLDLKNHLSGLKSKYLRVSFPSTVEQIQFRRELFPQIRKNQKAKEKSTEYTTLLTEYMEEGKDDKYADVSPLEQIVDIREYDLPFDMRVCIDGRFFVGHWYTVVGLDLSTQKPVIELNPSIVEPPEPIICAFDIETTKAPLKFPHASEDQIMMISYMIDGSGFLIVNRQIISEDIDNFEYTPKPEFVGEFVVFNEENEQNLLIRFFDHLLKIKPSIMVTYNGDFFDWPFVDARANYHGINMSKYLGFYKDSQDEYKHSNCVHMDAFSWVQRDSYLPMGSQSLKAATREKLRYDPIELDPEEMVPMAKNQPKVLANYSVSDAVSTYYLYTKYVHPFIFALCTIIPLSPDDVLRKGSGTLCEALLMVQAFHSNIIFPNKQIIKENKMTLDGHLIDSETYVGGHVEAIESGVFRSDIACRFKLDVEALEQLKEDVRPTIEHSICNDAKISISEVIDFESVCEQIELALDDLIEKPLRTEHPELYHLDVGAMYPNIILTNRLQPPAVVNEEQCMACIHNAPDAKCKRKMDWVWRGECIPATKGEYDRLMMQLEQERFGKPPRPFNALPKEERAKISKKRITEYCKTAYKRLHDTKIEQRNTTICQREHSFYVDTVRAFRDRRYEYKEMHKKAKASVEAIPSGHLADRKSAQSRVILYDSLQMAHKCILNSFYGYVMRKGSRWFSMEMAGIVCHTGACIIREARQLIECIGRPLELDTDGIWCLLPSSFPQNFVFETKNGKRIKISYPAAVLNALVKDRFTNEQYHTIIDSSNGECIISSENSIFFEVDGPYYAMILPASKEEGKKLKKRYAVFNFDKSLAELKGFEVKRRGELAIIKYFQTEVFKCFLKGSTLEEIYSNVAQEANYWLSILYDQGRALSLSELFELIGESKNMSKALEDYGSQKSTSITTAKRLAEFLGEGMVKNRGLACKFIVSRFPIDEPVTERTIPQAIFDSEPNIRCRFLRRWTKCSHLDFADENVFRELIDWQYYIERLNSCIQKIVTIPAALQGLPNPVPKVPHPQWLENKRKERVEMHIQPRITDLFMSINGPTTPRNVKTKSLQSTPWSLKSKKSTTSTNVEQSRKSLFGKEKDDKLLLILNDDIENQPSTSIIEQHQTSTTIIQQNDEIIQINEEINILEITQQQKQSKQIKIAKKPEKSKMAKQREAKRLAIAQHCSRRLCRADYDLNKQSLVKKTWKENGFSQWLAYLKDLWRLQYLARKRQEPVEADNSLANIPSTSTTAILGGPMIKRKHCWQIIQILETKFPGQFTLFALVDDIIRRINLIVPRTVYVDDIEERQNSIGQLVQKLLPRQRPSANLYEFCIDEAIFSTKMIDLNVQMCLMRINGIYETKIPLIFKTIAHTGIYCNIDGKNANNELSLEQINRLDDPSISSTFSDFNFLNLPIIYLYEYLHSGRSISSLFMPSFGKGFVFVVNREPVDLLNLNNFYLNELNRFINQKSLKEDEFIGLEQCKKIELLEIYQNTSIKDSSRKLQKIFNGLKLSHTEPFLLVIQSNRLTKQLLKDFPSLLAFPNVTLRIIEPSNLMNMLDWANTIVKRSVQHFFICFTYLKEYWSFSSYLEIPIGNLPEDIPSFGLDALFARQLKTKNYLLWASPSSLPDFGGKDLEDLRLSNEWENCSFTGKCCGGDYLINKEIFEARYITAEISIGALAVTALLQSVRISEAEGSSEYIGFTSNKLSTLSIEELINYRFGGLSKYNDCIAVNGELGCLREMFHRLVKDIHYRKNLIADQLVINMHRWICDPNSLLFNPAIKNALSTLMKKLCLLLVAEIQRLGAKVIYCSFRKIVFSTERYSLPLAKSFVNSLLIAINQKPVFASLQLGLIHFSSVLLWIDSSNYAFVFASEDEKKNGRVEAKFGLANKITGEIKNKFIIMIAGFVGMLWNKRRELNEEDLTDHQLISKYSIQILKEEIIDSLFRLTTKLVFLRPKLEEMAKENFCLDIPLEFINCICRVLSVNPALEEHVDNLKSQLLLIIQKDGTIQNNSNNWIPPTCVILENIFCAKCSQNGDLDVSNDVGERNLTEQQKQGNQAANNLPFLCPHCGSEYRLILIEEMLVERVSKMQTSFALQDWQCVACKKIGANFLLRHCECSNKFEYTLKPEELIRNLDMVKRVAIKHKLENLEYVVEHVTRCLR